LTVVAFLILTVIALIYLKISKFEEA
jgi:hypothetical protein